MNLLYPREHNIFKTILILSGIYGIFWGISVLFFPDKWLNFAALPPTNYPEIFQITGIFELFLGLSYLIASKNPLRNWQVVLLGFFIKVAMAVGFIFYAISKANLDIIFHIIFVKDIIWILPFALILYNAFMHEHLLDNEIMKLQNNALPEILNYYHSDKNNSLLELSKNQSVLLVFLRFFKCPFCISTLEQIASEREAIESNNVKIVLVNMTDSTIAAKYLKIFHLNDLDYFADEETILYKSFLLRRGSIFQIFGPSVLFRLLFMIFKKNSIKTNDTNLGDIFQMPGIFILKDGKIIKEFRYKNIAEHAPIVDMVSRVS